MESKARQKARRWLCSRSDFVRVQGQGRRFRGPTMVLLVAQAPPYAQAAGRLGLTVSRKVGNAVARNRVRRVLREAWRQLDGASLTSMDHVVIAFPQAAGLHLAAAQRELACLLVKAQQWASRPESVGRSWRSTG